MCLWIMKSGFLTLRKAGVTGYSIAGQYLIEKII